MRQIAFVFPGQGSQHPGMGLSLFPCLPDFETIFAQAREVFGFDVAHMCKHGTEDTLRRTLHAQPTLLTVEWITYRILIQHGLKPVLVAGHSLGEYTAMAATGTAPFRRILELVRERARIMEEVSARLDGGMLAIVGLSRDKVSTICERIGQVTAANFNSPRQTVVSGTRGALERAAEQCMQAGARRVVPLRVSGPFHSPLMHAGALQFASVLDAVHFRAPACGLIPNATARIVRTTSQLKSDLQLQMDHAVLWEDSVRTMLTSGIELFVEVGPGNVLQGLHRRIDRSIPIFGLHSPQDLERLLQSVR